MAVIRGTDFEDVRVGRFDAVPNRYLLTHHADRKRLQPWDIVLETAGGSKDRPTGRSLLIKPSTVARVQGNVTCASFARFLRVDREKADPAYVFWLLQHLYSSRALRQFNTQHTGVARFQFTTFATTYALTLPPVETQRRVASILSAYDDHIENNTRRIAILEEMARRLYEEWFVHFRFPGHDTVRLKQSDIGLAPEAWSVSTVEQTFEIIGGGTPSKTVSEYWDGGTINWYTPSDLTAVNTSFMDESGALITEEGLNRSSARLFPPWCVMMTSRATLGVVAINTTPAATNQGFITCVPNSRVPLYLLFHWLKANAKEFEAIGTGATFKEITKGAFKKLRLSVPPKDLASRFEELVEPIMLLVLNLQRQTRNLTAARNLLLPKLVSGEVGASVTTVPAEVAAA